MQYQSILQATDDSARKVTTELKSIKSMSEKGYWKPNYAKSGIDFYLNIKSNRDEYYSIQKRATCDGGFVYTNR